MTEIHLLDASVYNKISAGEVIERPASVVKELVENALDAGATEISICYRGGGLEEITVSDNGKGIDKADLPSVFLPHATSKIATAEDLFRVSTMGFRGEAMASIAAIAMVSLTSCKEGATPYVIEAAGGQIGVARPVGGTVGTVVCVRNLFYHTPARLKFLRSAKQEGRDIVNLVERMIIANPSVRFRLEGEGKEIYHTTGSGLDEAVTVVFGEDAYSHMLPIEAEEYGYKVTGYTSDTMYTAGTRSMQITVVNGRVVANANLYGTINNAYRDYLMKRNYALYALHIEVPSDEVDVNVHPTKADVRFVYASKLYGFVYRAVRQALETSLAERNIVFDTLASHDASATQTDTPDTLRTQDSLFTFAEDSSYWDNYRRERDTRPAVISIASHDLAIEPMAEEAPQHEDAAVADTTESPAPQFDRTALRIVGQVMGTYIIAEYDGDMLLIDKHAAAERVLYNRLMAEYRAHGLSIQPMLIPYEFTLGAEDTSRLLAHIDGINALGIELSYDGNGFALHAIPSLLTEMDVQQFVHILLSDGFESETGAILHERLAYAACRAAVKGNTYLDNEGLHLLCDSLFADAIPGQCPHGRPAYVRISRRDLDKMFKRIV